MNTNSKYGIRKIRRLYNLGLSPDDIADVLNITIDAVRVAIYDRRKICKKENRGSYENFKNYMINNKYYFEDIFRMPLSEKNIRLAFKQANELIQKLDIDEIKRLCRHVIL